MGQTSSYSGGMRITNTDNAKMFLGHNSWADGQVNNSDYDPVDMPIGTLMGRITSSGLFTPLQSGASDGSQIPRGILAANYTIDDGDTVDVRICTGGEVDENLIVLQGSDTLNTVITGVRLRDRIAADTVGIVLRTVTELSDFDNQ